MYTIRLLQPDGTQATIKQSAEVVEYSIELKDNKSPLGGKDFCNDLKDSYNSLSIILRMLLERDFVIDEIVEG